MAYDLAATVRAEQASGQPTCGHTCRCHGNYVCVRTVHDDHGNHWRTPDGETHPAPPGPQTPPPPDPAWTSHDETRTPHAAWQEDGTLVVWQGPHFTDEQIDAAAAEAKAEEAARIANLRAALGLTDEAE